MPEQADALRLVTDPANVSRMAATGPDERFEVNSRRVLRALREDGAGKAEARELALGALSEAGGGADLRTSRGPQRGARGQVEVESWWVPKRAVRF
jgi:hypothetical protein